MTMRDLALAIRDNNRKFSRHYNLFNCLQEAAGKLGVNLLTPEDMCRHFKIAPWDVETIFRTHYDSPQSFADFAESL